MLESQAGGLGGGRRGRARAAGKEGAAFLGGGDQTPFKAGAGDSAQGQVLRLHNQPSLRDPSQSWRWRLSGGGRREWGAPCLPGSAGLPRVTTKEKEEIQKGEVKRTPGGGGAGAKPCGPGRIGTGEGARKRHGGEGVRQSTQVQGSKGAGMVGLSNSEG